MTDRTNMSLIKVIIKSNYRNLLLTLLSDLNTVHIKSKTKKGLKVIEKDLPFAEKVKNLRLSLDALFKKINLTDSDFQDLKFKKAGRIEFIVKDLIELLNHTSEEISFIYNRITELDSYIVEANIELENLSKIKSSYYFLEKFNLTRVSPINFNYLNFKVYSTFAKNLPNLKTLFEFTQFPNVYQTYPISEDRIVFYIIYPKEREDDLRERISVIHAEEIPILKKYLTQEGINFNRIFKEIDLIKTSLLKYEKEQRRIRDDNLLKFAAINEIVQNIEEYHWALQQFEELPSGRLVLEFFVPIKKKKKSFHI